MKWGKSYCYPLTIQFEDVDSQQVVHHPNYLKYCERARIHAMEVEGYPFAQMIESGFGFVVCDARIRYQGALRFGQKLCLQSQVVAVASASYRLRQVIHSGSEELCERLRNLPVDDWLEVKELLAVVDMALVHIEIGSGRPKPFHDHLQRIMGIHLLAEQGVTRDQLRPRDVRMS